MAAIVAIMVFLATFALAAEASLSAITLSWHKDMESHMTVEIPAAPDEASTPQAERVRQAISILRSLPDAGLVMPLPDDETARLLKPWFDQPDLLKTLYLPTLIDVEMKPGSSITAAQIQEQIKTTIPDARVNDHAAWLGDLRRLVNGLAVMAALIILLTGCTLIIAVNLACRAVMASERDTIALLHIIGAEDTDIARHFQAQMRLLAIRPAAAGFLLALAAAALLLLFARHLTAMPGLTLGHGLALTAISLLVPLAAVSAASLSARLSVLKLLRAVP